MRILVKMRRQTAVYWEPYGHDEYGGVLFLEPRELRVRWEKGGEEMLEYDGKQVMPEHTVYSGEDLVEGGMLFLGTLDDVEGAQIRPETALRIKKTEIIPTLKAKKFLRLNYL